MLLVFKSKGILDMPLLGTAFKSKIVIVMLLQASIAWVSLFRL